MTRWTGVIIVLVTCLAVQSAALCDKDAVKACTQGLDQYGVKVDEDLVLSLLDTATTLGITEACSAQFRQVRQCLQGLVDQCDSSALYIKEAGQAKAFLEYLCTDKGLKGVSQTICLNTEVLLQSLESCRDKFLSTFKSSGNGIFLELSQYILKGAEQWICDLLQKARLCFAEVTAAHCDPDTALFADRLIQQPSQLISKLLKCHEGALGTKCSPNPCRNGGTCLHITDDLQACACALGYSGQTCGQLTGCASDSCAYGGRCDFDGTVTSCTCTPGYFGPRCQDTQPQQGADNQQDSEPSFVQSHTFTAIVIGSCALIILIILIISLLYCHRRKKLRGIERIRAQQERARTGIDSIKGRY